MTAHCGKSRARASAGKLSSRAIPWLALLCLMGCTVASALSPGALTRDLRHTAWSSKEGAPADVQALAQTSDGYLWIGNASGLYRFDGLQFDRIELPRDDRLSSSNIYTLYASPNGGLWIGFTVGNIAFFKDGHWTTYGEADGLWAGNSIIAFAQDQDGTVWAGAPGGLARLEGARWRQVGADFDYPADTWTQALLVDSAGTLWAAGRNNVLFLPKGEKRFRPAAAQPRKEVRTSEADSVGLAESPSGAVWLLCDKQLRRLTKNANADRRTASSGFGFLFDRDGNLWTEALDGRVRRIAQPETLAQDAWVAAESAADAYGVEDGLSAPGGAGALLEDSEGNLWISSEAGMDRFSESNVTRVLPSPDQHEPFFASEAIVTPVDRSGLWIGGRTFPLFNLQDGKATRYDELGFISAAYRADDGTLWVAASKRLWKRVGNAFVRIDLPEGSGDQEPLGMTGDHAGGLWISLLANGVYRLADGVWTDRGGHASLPKGPASTMASDADGRVWFAYAAGRVAVLDGSKVTDFAGGDRLPVGNVTAFYGKRGRVWAGGDYGLALFDGVHFQPVMPETPGAFDSLTGIVETADGDLWLNCRAGIVHVTNEETRRWEANPSYRIRGETFDVLDGVQGGSARLGPPSATEDSDGRLLFTTSYGIYAIFPAHIARSRSDPTVLIQSVTANDKRYAPSSDLQLPPRTTSLRIDYVSVNLTQAGKVRYRYKLDGVDDDWRDVKERRQAFYTSLGPGPHRFHVIASNGDGLWSETGATMDFAIAPTFVQTRSFLAICAIAVTAVFWGLIRFRFRQLAGRMRERFDERLAERERIARELHDTLLQSTQALIFKIQAATEEVSIDDPARMKLERALDQADDLLVEGRDRIQDLRSSEGASSELWVALAGLGEELAKDSSSRFRVAVERPVRALNPTVGDEVYHIAREALRNAFRHSQATSIEMRIEYADEEFRLHVRDDGVGIDKGVVSAGSRPHHWGLTGMRERADRIGARLGIMSQPGTGTDIELTISGALAYRQENWRWLRRWRR